MRREPGTGRTGLQPYWDEVSGRYAPADPLAAVCYPGAPVWFNRFIARFQLRAVHRALDGVPLLGRHALDVGCGMGRWTRLLQEAGARVTGVDPTAEMLEAARRLSPALDYRRMSATALDLDDTSFDLVTSVTVLQHLRPEEQAQAVGEIARVLKPGGRALLLELIDEDDRGPVVYPRPPAGWIGLAREKGLVLDGWRGQEYIPLLRIIRRARAGGAGRGEAQPGDARQQASAFERVRTLPFPRAALLALRATVVLSYPVEWFCERMAPPAWARHGAFVFRKR